MSCNVSFLTIRRMVLLAGPLLLIPSLAFGAYSVSDGSVTGKEYRDQVLGGGSADGDIWGGEQGQDPWINPEGPVPTENVPIINTLPKTDPVPSPRPVPRSGRAGWLVQLASFFDWFQTSQWFSNSR
jgi:hypothetical protein